MTKNGIKIMELIFKEEVYKIIGAAMEVYNALGAGFLEAVYQEALTIEFESQLIPFKTQVELPIYYKNKPLKKLYVADFIVWDKIIVEIKAQENLTKVDEAQLLNYLKASKIKLGLLINFGNKKKLEWKRIIN